MTKSKEWFEDDEIWEWMYPIGFTDKSFQSAADLTDRLMNVLGTPPGGAVLDLCCGPGRYSIPIAQRGFRVTAVDRTRLHLKRLRERQADAGVALEIVEEDMLTFRRENAFDSAINLGTSFGYFEKKEDDRSVLENVCASLKPGGRFIMEIKGRENIIRSYQERGWSEVGDRYVLQERTFEPGCERLHNRWVFIEGDRRCEYNFYLRLYTAPGLANLLRSIGFAAAEAYADLDGTPYGHEARLLWMIATR